LDPQSANQLDPDSAKHLDPDTINTETLKEKKYGREIKNLEEKEASPVARLNISSFPPSVPVTAHYTEKIFFILNRLAIQAERFIEDVGTENSTQC
jgi:hypothetical protein